MLNAEGSVGEISEGRKIVVLAVVEYGSEADEDDLGAADGEVQSLVRHSNDGTCTNLVSYT